MVKKKEIRIDVCQTDFWEDATVNIPPVKVPVTLRLDPNVLAWYKQQVPRGYQTLINNVLQKYMTEHQA